MTINVRRKLLTTGIVPYLVTSCFSLTALAQGVAQETDSSAASGLTCLGCSGFVIILSIIVFILNICLLVWVAKDAKARGMDTPVIWMLVVLFFGIFGLLVYIFSRPSGVLVKCSNCGHKRLEASLKCRVCGKE